MKRLVAANVILLFIVIWWAMFIPVGHGFAQNDPSPNSEMHDTVFGTIIVQEIKRDDQPNLVCYGLDKGPTYQGIPVLTGCLLRN